MTVNDFIKTLLSNKFKKFVELIKILKIEINNDSKSSNNKSSNSKFNHDKINYNDKNNENFVMNYYKKINEKISFKIKKTKKLYYFILNIMCLIIKRIENLNCEFDEF